MTEADAKEQIYRLISGLRRGGLSTLDFCDQFEQIYNLDLDKSNLTSTEAKSFAALFERVIWYSPYPEERTQIPNYVDETEVRKAADDIVIPASIASRSPG